MFYWIIHPRAGVFVPLFGSSSEDKMKQQKIIFVPTIFVFRMQSLHYFKYIMAGAARSGAMQNVCQWMICFFPTERFGLQTLRAASQWCSLVNAVVSSDARNLKCPVQHDSPISILICFAADNDQRKYKLFGYKIFSKFLRVWMLKYLSDNICDWLC